MCELFLAETSDDINEIVRSVDSKWLGVNLDTNNFPDDKYEQIEDVAYRVVHVHAKFLEVEDSKTAVPKATRFLRSKIQRFANA